MVSMICRVGCALAAVATAQDAPAVIMPGYDMDLQCATSGKNETWRSIRGHFRDLFGPGTAFAGVKNEELVTTLNKAMDELSAVKALSPEENECGLGKLNLQMLSVNTINDPAALMQLHTSLESLASPVLTMLLDVPWLAIAESGWPVFGFLSQLNQRRRELGITNSEDADGLQTPVARAFFVEITQALATGNIGELRQLSLIYLNLQEEGNAFGALTALAAQAAVEISPNARVQLLEMLQNGFKQSILTAQELDFALGTQWPLWGLVHEAVDALAAPLSASA